MTTNSTSTMILPGVSAVPPVAEAPNPELEIIDYLQKLYVRAQDSVHGYQKASELVKNTELESFFTSNSKQREKFALELEGHIRRCGAEPDKQNSLIGKLHQSWMTILNAFTNDETQLVDECIRGEESAIGDYEDALTSYALSPDVEETIKHQRDQIRTELESLKTLKESNFSSTIH